MQPTHCRVPHDPPHSYGDCLRACIATIMDREPRCVPHFADNGVSGDEAMAAMRSWLITLGYAPFLAAWPGDIPLADLLDMMRILNPGSTYVLFGGTVGGADHCVVCQGGQVVHNPAWYGATVVGPLSNGTWQVLVVGRV